MNFATTNTIRIEPRQAEVEGSRLAEFWRVFVDGVELSSSAKPFASAETELIIRECVVCGRCAWPEVVARRLGDDVLWLPVDAQWRRWPQRDWLRLFNVRDYERAVGGDASKLPPVESAELLISLRSQPLPDLRTALYTVPELDGDPSGLGLLRSIVESIQDDAEAIEFVSAPTQPVGVRIGLDVDRVPECVIQLGRCDVTYAVRLESHPSFPAWFTSAPISKVLRALDA